MGHGAPHPFCAVFLLCGLPGTALAAMALAVASRDIAETPLLRQQHPWASWGLRQVDQTVWHWADTACWWLGHLLTWVGGRFAGVRWLRQGARHLALSLGRSVATARFRPLGQAQDVRRHYRLSPP